MYVHNIVTIAHIKKLVNLIQLILLFWTATLFSLYFLPRWYICPSSFRLFFHKSICSILYVIFSWFIIFCEWIRSEWHWNKAKIASLIFHILVYIMGISCRLFLWCSHYCFVSFIIFFRVCFVFVIYVYINTTNNTETSLNDHK